MNINELKKPYLIISVSIAAIIIISMYLTQSYWMGIGEKILYKEYNVDDIISSRNIPKEDVFILSGNFSRMSGVINTSEIPCKENTDVKILAHIGQVPGTINIKKVYVLNMIEGCK